MAKFCGKCGAKIDETTGLCPNCNKTERRVQPPVQGGNAKPVNPGVQRKNQTRNGSQTRIGAAAQKRAASPETKKQTEEKPKKKKKSKAPAIIAILLVLIIACVGVIGYLVYSDKLDIPFVNSIFVSMGLKDDGSSEPDTSENESTTEETPTADSSTTAQDDVDLSSNYEVPSFDAEEYFKNNTSLITSFDAYTSQTVSTEEQVYNNFYERGFTEVSITYDYSMDGLFCDTTEISSYSSERHPTYQAYYTTQSGNIWLLLEVNGSVFASPAFYNFEDETRVPVLLSETNSITSYDGKTNKFYVNVPDQSETVIKTVSRIDAATLERLTGEEIDKL